MNADQRGLETDAYPRSSAAQKSFSEFLTDVYHAASSDYWFAHLFRGHYTCASPRKPPPNRPGVLTDW